MVLEIEPRDHWAASPAFFIFLFWNRVSLNCQVALILRSLALASWVNYRCDYRCEPSHLVLFPLLSAVSLLTRNRKKKSRNYFSPNFLTTHTFSHIFKSSKKIILTSGWENQCSERSSACLPQAIALIQWQSPISTLNFLTPMSLVFFLSVILLTILFECNLLNTKNPCQFHVLMNRKKYAPCSTNGSYILCSISSKPVSII